MNTFNYFKQNGKKYILKPQVARLVFLMLGCLAIGVFVIYNGQGWAAGGVLFILSAMVGYRLTYRITFDTEKKEVLQKKGAFGGTRVLPFRSFDSFTIMKARSSTMGIGSELRMVFEIDGRVKDLVLRQAFGTKSANRLAREAEQIMKMSDNE